jgi:hypothetical protein
MTWHQFWRRYKNKRKQKRDLRNWIENGKPVPPPHIVKQKVVLKFARLFNCKIFVETGTYKGEMVASVQNEFERIYSIELDRKLFDRASVKFKDHDHISVYRGDSGKLLVNIIENMQGRALFWLDAHYSGGITAKAELETPIIKELETIFDAPNLGHVILIDDAREFIGKNNYPSFPELRKMVLSRRPQAIIEVEDDIIQILPKK